MLSKIFPTKHAHGFDDVMKEKITRHIEPTIDLSEMETGNMVKILEKLSMRYLELLVERLDDQEKEDYMNSVVAMRSGEISLENLRKAEKCVMSVGEKFGKPFLIGDQLTVIYSFSYYY